MRSFELRRSVLHRALPILVSLAFSICRALAQDLVVTMTCHANFNQGKVIVNNTGNAPRPVEIDVGFRSNCAGAPSDADFEEYPAFTINPGSVVETTFGTIGLTAPQCDDYVAFARVRSGSEIHEDAYCVRGTDSNPIARDDLGATILHDLVVSNDLDLTHVRGLNEATCVLGTGEARMALSNPTPPNGYRGVFTGKYSCLSEGQTTNPMDYCLDGTICKDKTEPPGNGFGRSFLGFDLTQACGSFSIHQAGTGLPRCCDCADLAVQCARYIVTHAKVPPATAYHRVLPPLWSPALLDTDPEFTAPQFGCDSFRNTALASPSPGGTCNFDDQDLDGDAESDAKVWCDGVRPSGVPATGGAKVLVVNPRIAEKPTGALLCDRLNPEDCTVVGVTVNDDVQFTTSITCGPNKVANTKATGCDIQEIPVGGACALADSTAIGLGPDCTLIDSFANTLEFIAPAMAPGAYTLDLLYGGATGCLVESGGTCFRPQAPNDLLTYRVDAHILSRDSATLEALTVDVGSLTPGIRDVVPSDFGNAFLPLGFNPRDLAYANHGPAESLQHRLYIVGEEEVTPGVFQGRLYLFDVVANKPIDLNGASAGLALALNGPARSIDIVGAASAYVLVEDPVYGWDIDVVNLNTANPSSPTVTTAALNFPSHLTPLRLRAQRVDASTNRVFVLHHDEGCEGPLGPMGPGFWCIEGCDPGSGPDLSRTLFLDRVDFPAAGGPASLEGYTVVDDYSGDCEDAPLEEAGMDFNAAGDELWVASPDLDRVRVVDLDTLVTSPVPIYVGAFPTGVDLEVVDSVERAYVANKLGDSYTVINVATKVLQATKDLPSGSNPTDLVVQPGGLKLLVVESGGDVIEVYGIPENTRLGVFAADSAPHGLVIQRGTTP